MKNLAKLGKALNKIEQQAINGGKVYDPGGCDPKIPCHIAAECLPSEYFYCCACHERG